MIKIYHYIIIWNRLVLAEYVGRLCDRLTIHEHFSDVAFSQHDIWPPCVGRKREEREFLHIQSRKSLLSSLLKQD